MRRLLFALLLAPVPGLAQGLSPLSPNANAPMPRCGPVIDGQVMCKFGVVYECEFVGPNGMERRTGWRWKSNVLRGCDTAPAAADLSSDRPERDLPDLAYSPQASGSDTQRGQAITQPSAGRSRHN